MASTISDARIPATREYQGDIGVCDIMRLQVKCFTEHSCAIFTASDLYLLVLQESSNNAVQISINQILGKFGALCFRAQ